VLRGTLTTLALLVGPCPPLLATNTATVTLSPANATVTASGTLAYYASVSGSASQTETWYVDGHLMGNASVGILSAGSDPAHVTYTAPTAAGSHTITCQASNASGTTSGSTSITVTSGNTAVVTLSPANATVAASGTVAYYASVSGSASQTETWYVDGISMGNASVGTLSAGSDPAHVTYTAPATAGSHTITCQASNASGTTSGSTGISVTSGNTAVVTLSPANASVAASGTVAYYASVSGSASQTETWYVDGISMGNASVGTLSAGSDPAHVTYTAPAAAGSHTITCQASNASGTTSGSTPVTVTTTATAVTLSPATPLAIGGGTQKQFTASVTGGSGTTAWSLKDAVIGGTNANLGTLTSAGLYTAPSVSVPTLVEIDATNNGVTASVRLVISPGTLLYNAHTTGSAAGDGVTDDTSAINNAMAAAGNGICFLPNTGQPYLVSPASGVALRIPTGCTLWLDNGAVIQMKTQTTPASVDYIAVVPGSNSALVGGTLNGDRAARNLPNGLVDGGPNDFEAGEGITIGSGSGQILLGVTAQNNCCDGLSINNTVSNVLVSDCTFTANRRNGSSVTGTCTNLQYQYTAFTYQNGNNPQAGVDLEPNANQSVTQIRLYYCQFNHNQGGGLDTGGQEGQNATTSYVTVADSELAYNGGSGYSYGGFRCVFSDHCTFTNNNVHDNANAGFSLTYNFTNGVVSGNSITNNQGNGITLGGGTGDPGECAGTTVTGNALCGNTGTAIYQYSAQTGATISGNTVCN
jgi:hypothetical protein